MRAIVIFLFSCCISCGIKDAKIAECEKVNICLSSECETLLPDSLFAGVEYIPLETTNNSLLVGIDKFLEKDSLFFILDKKQAAIFVFNNRGQFLNKLDKKGRGSGEYLSLDDFFIRDSFIYILSSAIQKILIYNINFQFNRDFKLNTFGTNINYIADTLFLYTNFASTDLKNFYSFDIKTGELFKKFESFPKKQLGVRYNQSTFAKFNEAIYCFLPFDYSIYRLYTNRIEKFYELNFGLQNMCPKNFKDYCDDERINYLKRYSNLVDFPVQRIDDLYLDDDFLYFNFVKGVFPYCFIKNDDQIKFGSIISTNKFPVANNKTIYVDKNKYVAYERAEIFFMCREKGFHFPHNIQNLKIDDNPVLCIYKF